MWMLVIFIGVWIFTLGYINYKTFTLKKWVRDNMKSKELPVKFPWWF